MSKLSTIIVDDDPASIVVLQNDLKKFPDFEVVDTTSSPLEAINKIEKWLPDVLFLDMEMSGMSGIELLKHLNERGLVRGRAMRVVFYTAYEKYMIDAIRASAFDYLLKPYKQSELKTILNRLVSERVEAASAQLNYEISLMKLLSSEQRFTLQSITGLLILHHSQVVCFRYIDRLRCWQVTLTDRQNHRLRTTTKAQDITGINPNFIQVNNSCIINVEYLASIENKTLRCCLYPPFNDLDICVSRHYFGELRNSLDRM